MCRFRRTQHLHRVGKKIAATEHLWRLKEFLCIHCQTILTFNYFPVAIWK
jgi:hypothetical protein